MRELASQETEAVNGGIAPVIGLAIAVASHAGARTVASYAISRAGTIVAGYSAAKYFGGSGH